MFCKKCGNPLKEGTKFCGACGAVVQDQAAPISNANPVAREVTPVKKSAPVTEAVAKKPLPVKKLLIAVAAVAVVVLLGVLVSSLFGGRTVYLMTKCVWKVNGDKTTYEYVYDKTGNLLECLYGDEEEIWDSWTFEYMDGHIITSQYEYEYDDMFLELEYIYSKKGNLVNVESDNAEIDVTCDKKGRIIEMEFDGYINSDELVVEMECSYYDNGMLKEQQLHYEVAGQFSIDRTYVYNEEGSRLEYESKYFFDGQPRGSFREKWEYDQKGNLTGYTLKYTYAGVYKMTMKCQVVTSGNTKEYIITRISGDVPNFTDYLEEGDTYIEETYDDHGNCIQRITYGEKKIRETMEYTKYTVPKGYRVPTMDDPQLCQFLLSLYGNERMKYWNLTWG